MEKVLDDKAISYREYIVATGFVDGLSIKA